MSEEMSGSMAVMTAMQGGVYEENFQFTLNRVAKVLPLILEQDRHALYAMYCGGRADQASDASANVQMKEEAAQHLHSQALRTYAAKSHGMDDEQYEEAINTAMLQELGEQHDGPH